MTRRRKADAKSRVEWIKRRETAKSMQGQSLCRREGRKKQENQENHEDSRQESTEFRTDFKVLKRTEKNYYRTWVRKTRKRGDKEKVDEVLCLDEHSSLALLSLILPALFTQQSEGQTYREEEQDSGFTFLFVSFSGERERDIQESISPLKIVILLHLLDLPFYCRAEINH